MCPKYKVVEYSVSLSFSASFFLWQPIFGVDTQGRVNVWNQCAMKLVGYSIDEVMGKNLVEDFISIGYRGAVKSVLDQAMGGTETANFEFPLITKGGARIEVLLNATTRRDDLGKVIGMVSIGQDITGRIAQEREYSKLIDTANAVCSFYMSTCPEKNVLES